MRQEAFIIKKIPVREFDELVVCYTKNDGKQTYQIKSSLKHTSKQGRHIDLLSYVDFNLVDGHVMPLIVSARCLDSFYEIKRELKSLTKAFFVLECLDRLVPENEPDPILWQNIFNFLNLTMSDDMNIDRLHEKILSSLGYPAASSVEEVAQTKFLTLDFARRMLL